VARPLVRESWALALLGLVEELWRALGPLLSRDDSPLGADEEGGVGWHFYPPLDEHERQLFARLDWREAVVLHEFVD
jgi:hypothetical protein